MEGWNGGRGSSWSYRQEIIGSNVSSSRSGTIVSTAYTSSGASRLSSVSIPIEAAMHFDSLGVHEEEKHDGSNVDDNHGDSMPWGWWEVAADECMVRIRNLVQEFSIEQSANCSIKIGGMSVVERWLTELGVGWEFSLDDDLRRWIWALDEISQTMCFMRPIFPDTGSMGLPSIGEDEHVGETCSPARCHLVLFIKEAMLKMLTFVDVIVAGDTYESDETEGFLSDWVVPSSFKKLVDLLDLHNALSQASSKILRALDSPNSVEVQKIVNEMTILLSANKSRVGEAIMSTIDKTRTKLMKDGDDLSRSVKDTCYLPGMISVYLLGSSDIHEVTEYLMRYIRFLCADAAIRGKYVPHIENLPPLDSMIIEMVSFLQKILANVSESFPDQGRRFLFLLNNLYYIQQQQQLVNLSPLQESTVLFLDLTRKIESHVERYVQVSWAPLLLSCLFNPTPLCLGKNYPLLCKFESEFQKIYTTQKQWKVPDPKLRRMLRDAIIDKIIPAYTEYLEENKVTTPKFTPRVLVEMLEELFEG